MDMKGSTKQKKEYSNHTGGQAWTKKSMIVNVDLLVQKIKMAKVLAKTPQKMLIKFVLKNAHKNMH